MLVPGLPPLGIGADGRLQVFQHSDVVQRVDVAGDDLRQRPDIDALPGIGRDQTRLRMKLVEKLDLSEPESGLGSVGMGQQIDTLQKPGELVGMFTAIDPIVHRQVFGIGRFDLDTRKFQFNPMGPMSGGMLGLHVTPDGKTGYTVTTSGAGGNKRSEFWVFDLGTNKLVRKAEFDGRARYSFAVSSDGKSLYIYAAGYQIEVYDAAALKLRNTIDVNTDITTEMIVLRPGE